MKIFQTIALTAILMAGATSLQAQHQHHTDTTKKQQPKDDHAGHQMHMAADTVKKQHSNAPMSSQFSLDLPMNRDGSGTSWVPDASPMYAYMKHGKNWMSMLHFNQFIRYNRQDVFKAGSRGAGHFDAPNMIMGMSQRRVGKNGLLGVNAMISFDPFLVGNAGYPLLFQTGESYKGQKLVDKQHPHDLFAALSVSYTQHVAENTDVFATVGYPAEPALGPPVFMHRLSGMNNPDAVLTHHYADATHISFGVATLGFRYKDLKAEGSVFTGREPDEKRYGFDKPRFDSYSVRLSYNPSSNWAIQASRGWIKSPEDLEPDHDKVRTTASVMHVKRLNKESFWASTLVYGQNESSGHHGKTLQSALLESTLQLRKTAIYGRYEFVRKDAHELDLHDLFPTNPNFNINAVTLGLNRIVAQVKNTDLRIGLQGGLSVTPTPLRSLYGNTPANVEVYIRINPSIMKM